MLSSRAATMAACCADSARAALLASASPCQSLLHVKHRLLKMMLPQNLLSAVPDPQGTVHFSCTAMLMKWSSVQAFSPEEGRNSAAAEHYLQEGVPSGLSQLKLKLSGLASVPCLHLGNLLCLLGLLAAALCIHGRQVSCMLTCILRFAWRETMGLPNFWSSLPTSLFRTMAQGQTPVSREQGCKSEITKSSFLESFGPG